MTTFPELRSLTSELDGERITLPIGGVEYSFSKNIPMRLGLALALTGEQVREMAKDGNKHDDETPPALVGFTDDQMRRALIGDQWDLMLANDVLAEEFDRVYTTLFAWHISGEAVAEKVWIGEISRKGDARPPARGASKARTTSPRSSTRTTSAASKRQRSAGKTS